MTWHHPREVFGETVLPAPQTLPTGLDLGGSVKPGDAPAVETPGEEGKPPRGLSARHFIALVRARAE